MATHGGYLAPRLFKALNDLDFNNHQILNLSAPTDDNNAVRLIDLNTEVTNLGTDIATAQSAADSATTLAHSLIPAKKAVVAATTQPLPVGFIYASDSGVSNGKFTVDGAEVNISPAVSVDFGDRVLVKDQSDAKQNGIYEYIEILPSGPNIFRRVADASGLVSLNMNGALVPGMLVGVTGKGSPTDDDDYLNKLFMLSAAQDVTVNTDNIEFVLVSGDSQALVAGNGIEITDSTTVSVVANPSGSLQVTGSGIDLKSDIAIGTASFSRQDLTSASSSLTSTNMVFKAALTSDKTMTLGAGTWDDRPRLFINASTAGAYTWTVDVGTSNFVDATGATFRYIALLPGESAFLMSIGGVWRNLSAGFSASN